MPYLPYSIIPVLGVLFSLPIFYAFYNKHHRSVAKNNSYLLSQSSECWMFKKQKYKSPLLMVGEVFFCLFQLWGGLVLLYVKWAVRRPSSVSLSTVGRILLCLFQWSWDPRPWVSISLSLCPPLLLASFSNSVFSLLLISTAVECLISTEDHVLRDLVRRDLVRQASSQTMTAAKIWNCPRYLLMTEWIF